MSNSFITMRMMMKNMSMMMIYKRMMNIITRFTKFFIFTIPSFNLIDCVILKIYTMQSILIDATLM